MRTDKSAKICLLGTCSHTLIIYNISGGIYTSVDSGLMTTWMSIVREGKIMHYDGSPSVLRHEFLSCTASRPKITVTRVDI